MKHPYHIVSEISSNLLFKAALKAEEKTANSQREINNLLRQSINAEKSGKLTDKVRALIGVARQQKLLTRKAKQGTNFARAALTRGVR